MGKPKAFQGKEAFQRMNFLFQASEFLVSHVKQPRLAAYYGSQMTSICKKSVLRMEPRVKRRLCKGCRAYLVPGVSSKIRLKAQSKNMIVSCEQCGTIKRFPTKCGYKLWVETPEACVETLRTGVEGRDSKVQSEMRKGSNKQQTEKQKGSNKQQTEKQKGSNKQQTEQPEQCEKNIGLPIDLEKNGNP